MDYTSDEEFDDLPTVSSINVLMRNKVPTSPNDATEENDDLACPDAKVVASHYNARPDAGLESRSRSTILHLRLFNNWIKSVLIREFVRGRGLKVLDLACGKGGDLGKWDRLAVIQYTGVGTAHINKDDAFCV